MSMNKKKWPYYAIGAGVLVVGWAIGLYVGMLIHRLFHWMDA